MITSSIKISLHEVTQDQHERAMRRDPSKLKNETNPIDPVGVEEAVEFWRKLSELPIERAAGDLYRLPMER